MKLEKNQRIKDARCAATSVEKWDREEAGEKLAVIQG
jgi:hypothetical protein